MTLLMSGMTYEPKIKNFEDISSESVLTMIREVIKELEPFRIGNCLRSALELTSIKITDMEGTTDTKLEKGQKFKVIVEYGNIADQTDLEPFRIGNCLRSALELIESGECRIPACTVITKVDLSQAKKIIETYRKYSEGGCQSCVKLGKEILDAQDGTSGRYCRESDPDYNEDATRLGRHGCHYEDFSPKVSKHYNKPCEVWKPTFSPTLEELIKANS